MHPAAPSPGHGGIQRRVFLRSLVVLLLYCSWLRRDRVVHGATVSHDVFMRYDELLKRGLNIVEVDIGDEAVDACIDATWLLPV
jgi:hypothetical protein